MGTDGPRSLRLDDVVIGGLLRLRRIPPQLRRRVRPEIFEHALRPVVRAILAVHGRLGVCVPAAVGDELASRGAGISPILKLNELEAVGCDPDLVEPLLGQLESRAGGQSGTSYPDLPDDAWVGALLDYRNLVGRTTEAPNCFHYATGSAICALALGRGASFNYPHPTRLNEYYLLTGPTGDAIKSTPIEYAAPLLRSLGEDVRVAGGLASAEGLIELLAKKEDTRLLLLEDELRVLFANAKRPGTQNILGYLNMLYRCPDELPLLKKGGIAAIRPFVCVLAATVPTWIERMQEVEATAGGFLNRFLILAGTPKDPISDPQPPPEKEWEAFTAKLREWRDALPKKPFLITRSEAAKARFAEWYVPWRTGRPRFPENIRHLTARAHLHVQKIAALNALLRGRTEVQPDDIARAISVVAYSTVLTTSLFGELTFSRLTRLENRILERLTDAGGKLPRRDLQGSIGGNYGRHEFNKALENLQRSGEVQVLPEPTPRGQTKVMVELVLEEEKAGAGAGVGVG